MHASPMANAILGTTTSDIVVADVAGRAALKASVPYPTIYPAQLSAIAQRGNLPSFIADAANVIAPFV